MDHRFFLFLSILTAAAAASEENSFSKDFACSACQVYASSFNQTAHSVEGTYKSFLDFASQICESALFPTEEKYCTERISLYEKTISNVSSLVVEQGSICEIVFGCPEHDMANELDNSFTFLSDDVICSICKVAAEAALDYFQVDDTIALGAEGARALCKQMAFMDTETCVTFVNASEAQFEVPTPESICINSGFCFVPGNEPNTVWQLRSRRFMYGKPLPVY